MVRPIAAFVAAMALGATIFAGEIDLTPKESYYLAEATKVPCVAFHNGEKEVSYTPPTAWKINGGGKRVTLVPPDKIQAGATIQVTPAKDPVPATDENLDAYAEAAKAYLPREATKVTVVKSGIALVKISRHDMAEVTLTYSLFGQAYTTNILFLPYEQQQLTFQVTARTVDYGPVSKVFRASLFSMQGL